MTVRQKQQIATFATKTQVHKPLLQVGLYDAIGKLNIHENIMSALEYVKGGKGFSERFNVD